VLANYYSAYEGRVYKVLGYWSTVTNMLGCGIMILVIRHVRKITQQPTHTYLPECMTSNVNEACKMNTLVTSVHIILIVTYTLMSFLADNVFILNQETTAVRVTSTWYSFAAIIDIFVAYMMFFILD
jgi:hypothetical protein